MYTSTFIFAAKPLDDTFYRLDQAIAAAAKAIPGYLGETSWQNQTTGLMANVYYWASLDALQALMQHPKHLEAKAAQAQWLAGYQVIIAKVIQTYGDGGLPAHPTCPPDKSAFQPFNAQLAD